MQISIKSWVSGSKDELEFKISPFSLVWNEKYEKVKDFFSFQCGNNAV